jgi:hypothetical protein
MSEKLHSLDKEQVRPENAAAAPEIRKRLTRWLALPQMAELMAEEEPTEVQA